MLNGKVDVLSWEQDQFDRDGYVVLRALLSPDRIRRIVFELEALWENEGAEAGVENYFEPFARRLANLANKGAVFRQLMCDERVLDLARSILGPDVRLNMLNARASEPRSGVAARFHRDFDPARNPHRPETPKDRGRCACTAIWMLDDFTKTNGATLIVPGSHRFDQYPREDVDDLSHPDEVAVEGKAGDVIVFNGHCWHRGGANTSDDQRRAVLVHYIRLGFRPRLDYRVMVSSGLHDQLTPRDRELLGLCD